MNELNFFQGLSFFVGISSLAVSAIAIWQANFWYKESKNTEASMRESLAEIKKTSNTLEKITNKQIDKYINYFTQKPEESTLDSFLHVFSVIREVTTSQQPPSQNNYPIQNIISDKMEILRYALSTNLLIQGYISRDIKEQSSQTQQQYIRNLNESKEKVDQTLRILEPSNIQETIETMGLRDWYNHYIENAYNAKDIYEINGSGEI